MSKISASNTTSLAPVLEQVREKTKNLKYLENAAQRLTDILYEAFSDSIVLVRMFATAPYGKLPAPNQAFVTKLATTNGITSLINQEMLVLSLLGTRGSNAMWNDRRKSQGHIGIPLASATFIDKIPMMSRLLKDIGLNLDWIDSHDTDIVTKTISGMSGVFYVRDAREAVDTQGRKIIAAQDFVTAQSVKTVFGLGGGYATSKTFLTVIVFCRETVNKTQAELFSPLVGLFKSNTIPLASSGAIFA
ncbi:MAG TPA: hypothetical protein PKH77_08780 [Anaerolineae bacterium]|nr:hypothetical protein [Anaerolineae bacterium]